MQQTPLERLAGLEKGIENLTTNVEDGFAAINAKVDKFIDAADDRYAPKWIGTAFMAGCAVILIAFIGMAVIEPIKNRNVPQQTVTVTTQNPNGTTTTRVIPLTGSGQIIQANPDTGNPQSGTSTTNDTPGSSTPTQDSTKSGICTIPVVGALCN